MTELTDHDKAMADYWKPKVTDVGPGWQPTVQKLLDFCAQNNLTPLQIKEKFGGLRFYYAPFNEEFEKLVDAAERDVNNLCEWCGAEATGYSQGWVKRLCAEHLKQWDEGKRWWE